MRLILHSDTETQFTHNGIGVLPDAYNAKVMETQNGTYELEFTYPLKGLHAEYIADRCIVMAKPNPVTDAQPFRIYRINPVSKGTVKVYAQHLAYDLMGIPAAPFTAASAADAMNQLKTNAVVDCPFSFYTDKGTAANMDSKVPKSIWKLLGGSEGSVLDVYGGEYEFDKYTVRLWQSRGADRGVSIRYGKNLSTLEQDRNCASVYTGVYPFWTSTEGDLVQLPEKVLEADGTYNFVRILDLDLSDRFEEAPTEDQLRARAKKYMTDNKIGVPDVSWKVTFVQLEQTEEYKGTALLERVLMGDTVSVVFPAMHVNATARVVETDFDPVLERYNSVTLGKVRADFASTIVKQNQAIAELPTKTTLLQDISNKLAAAMGVHGGCVRFMDTNGDGEPDELYIADDPDPAEALKVWRFNYMGWAASKTGYSGPYTLGATLEDGLLAEFVTACHLVAGTITSKDGNFFIDLDTGVVKINAIGEAVDEALATVEGTYATKAALELTSTSFSSTISAINQDISDLESADSTLSSRISQNATNITAKVSKGDVSSQISVESGAVSIGSSRMTIDSTNFKVAGTGEVTATGTLTTTSTVGSVVRKAELSSGYLKFYRDSSEIASLVASQPVSGKNVLYMDMSLDGMVFCANSDYYMVVNNGLNPGGQTQRVYLYNVYVDEHFYTDDQIIFRASGTSYNVASLLGYGTDYSDGFLRVVNNFDVNGDFTVTGTKSRAVTTENYGRVSMQAMESATAVFSDMGGVTLDDNGDGYVFLDPIFAETIDLSHEYQVFTSNASTVEKFPDYFVVHGAAGADVDWVVFYRQKGYTEYRTEPIWHEPSDPDPYLDMDESVFYQDDTPATQSESLMETYQDTYDEQAAAYLENYEQEIYGV